MDMLSEILDLIDYWRSENNGLGGLCTGDGGDSQLQQSLLKARLLQHRIEVRAVLNQNALQVGSQSHCESARFVFKKGT